MSKKQYRLLGYLATWCCGLLIGVSLKGGQGWAPPDAVPAPVAVSQPLPNPIANAVSPPDHLDDPASSPLSGGDEQTRTPVSRDRIVPVIGNYAHTHGTEHLAEYCEKLLATARTDDPLFRVEVLRGQARAIEIAGGNTTRVLQLQQEACAAVDNARMLLLRMRMDCYLDHARSLEGPMMQARSSTAPLLAALAEVFRCYDEADRAPLSTVSSRESIFRECVARYQIGADLAVKWMTKQQRAGLYLEFNAINDMENFSPEWVLDLGAVGNSYSEGDEFEFYKWCQNYIAEQDKLNTPESAKASQAASEFLKLLEPIVKGSLRDFIASEDFQDRLQRKSRGEPPIGYRAPEPTDLSPYLKKESLPPSQRIPINRSKPPEPTNDTQFSIRRIAFRPGIGLWPGPGMAAVAPAAVKRSGCRTSGNRFTANSSRRAPAFWQSHAAGGARAGCVRSSRGDAT